MNQGPFGPWNPGLRSPLPSALLPQVTVFRPEHVSTGLARARELQDLTGLPLEALVCFRPRRLAVHELLVRVTADFTVEDGARSEDLGINFRRLAEILLTRHLDPRMAEIERAHAALREALQARIDEELRTLLDSPTPKKRGLGGFLRRSAPAPADPSERESTALRDWEGRAAAGNDAIERAACRALGRVVGAVRARHGRLWGDRTLLAGVATDLACNEAGSDAIGDLIDPWLVAAVGSEGLRRLPVQARPVVLNTKGASASGKSSMRPLQRALAQEIGERWEDFALISPDIWRKFLLDYDSLGEHYKYAGTFTSLEIEIIDQKLDRYMARKAGRGAMSHLLIDRFRFDSFAPESDEAGSNLLTRFGDLVYLFFMVTPPHATVERAWLRGLEVGRYKSVDDLLAHNVEAFNGMPQLFFTWALRADKAVHYEFLDNDVPQGARPGTIAFGWNGEMNVLDVRRLLDVERYRHIEVGATTPQAVYPGADAMAAARNTGFLAQCLRRLPAVNFALQASGRLYARTENGRLAWSDPQALGEALAEPDTGAALRRVLPGLAQAAGEDVAPGGPRHLSREGTHTLGHWGGALRR
ncbi:MAG TPA: hypothetical protein VIS77_14505 [Burkholderiales bacterium]